MAAGRMNSTEALIPRTERLPLLAPPIYLTEGDQRWIKRKAHSLALKSLRS